MLQPRVALPPRPPPPPRGDRHLADGLRGELRRHARPGDRRGRHDGRRAGRGDRAGAGAQMVALAQAEIGQTEQPPGSNDSPRIAEYRTATAGSGIGPWCNYFVSWAAKQAGVPLGEQGQGFGAVAATWDWAQRTGRAIQPTEKPNPGDLIVWDGRHIGMVESVLPDGRIQTIEGNSSNMVTRRVHSANGDGATGFVRSTS